MCYIFNFRKQHSFKNRTKKNQNWKLIHDLFLIGTVPNEIKGGEEKCGLDCGCISIPDEPSLLMVTTGALCISFSPHIESVSVKVHKS